MRQDFRIRRNVGQLATELAKFNHPTHQISFHTFSALETLKYLGSEKIYGK